MKGLIKLTLLIAAAAMLCMLFMTSCDISFLFGVNPETCEHEYGEFVTRTEGDCQRTGEAVRTCKLCGHEDVSYPLGDHAYGELIAAKAPTASEEGNIEHYRCSVCGKTFDARKTPVDNVTIPKLSSAEVALLVNGESVSMNLITYGEGEFTSYVYGYVELKKGDTLLIQDARDGMSYGYDELAAESKSNSWDFYCGNNGEIVINNPTRYGIKFDLGGSKEIIISKLYAPISGSSFGVDVGYGEPLEMNGVDVSADPEVFNGIMEMFFHETTVNAEDVLSFVEENGLYVYFARITLDEGEKFNIKNLADGSVIDASHLADAFYAGDSVTVNGEYVEIVKSGIFNITYIPAFNQFTIEKADGGDTPDPGQQGQVHLLVGELTVSLTPDENGDVVYNGFAASDVTVITVTDSEYSFMNMIVDPAMDASLVQIVQMEGYSILSIVRAGTYDLRYNVNTEYVYIAPSDGSGAIDPADCNYFVGIATMESTTQTLPMVEVEGSLNELCVRGITVEEGNFLAVTEISKDGSTSVIYGNLAETDESVAGKYGELVILNMSGKIDVYFNLETKTIRITPSAIG